MRVVHTPSTVTAVPTELHAMHLLSKAAARLHVAPMPVVGDITAHAVDHCNAASEVLGIVADSVGRCDIAGARVICVGHESKRGFVVAGISIREGGSTCFFLSLQQSMLMLL